MNSTEKNPAETVKTWRVRVAQVRDVTDIPKEFPRSYDVQASDYLTAIGAAIQRAVAAGMGLGSTAYTGLPITTDCDFYSDKVGTERVLRWATEVRTKHSGRLLCCAAGEVTEVTP